MFSYIKLLIYVIWMMSFPTTYFVITRLIFWCLEYFLTVGCCVGLWVYYVTYKKCFENSKGWNQKDRKYNGQRKHDKGTNDDQ